MFAETEYCRVARSAHVIVCEPWVTMSDLLTAGAARYVAFPAWFAAITTVPTPVTVIVLPLRVAGPLVTE